MESLNTTVTLFSAFLDDRELVVDGATVRILTMIKRGRSTMITFCQLWFDYNSPPVVSEVFEYRFMWREKWGRASYEDYQESKQNYPRDESIELSVPAIYALMFGS